MTALYSFQRVSYTAPPRNRNAGPTRIILDATFEVPRGVFTVISGVSGSGKTTLLRLFNRLADPSSGTILFEGEDIRRKPVIDLRRQTGWVPQVPVRFSGTVEENLRLPFLVNKKFRSSAEGITGSIESLMALELLPKALLSRDAADLSVGEAQRLNLLRALALKPDVLLLDEPTSALDPETADSLLEHIVRIQTERNLTVIMVSHRPEEVNRVNGIVLHIKHGRVHPHGSEVTR
jgi:ABC-type methionine transport system ATPase subunit